MVTKVYDYLPQDAKQIRTAVFVDEQGFKEEFDKIDSTAVHLMIYDGDKPVATCRFFWNEEKQSYTVGRIAVIKEYRMKGLGSRILKEAENQIRLLGGKTVCLHAQTRARGFYEKQGYVQKGGIEYEEYCPHVWMWKDI
jgi:predicted GNAT family N-acyltransferase